jgi:hypothetical protein
VFCRRTEEIFSYIKENPNFNILIAETYQVEQLLIQNLIRDKVEYLSLRNIVISKECRGIGLFKDIVNALEETKRPILIDDILNESLFSFFAKRGYISYEYVKNNKKIKCMVKRV